MNPLMPAFPRPEALASPAQQGMSVRTWLAGQAMAGLLANSECIDGTIDDLASDCVRNTDALIAALSAEPPLIRANPSEAGLRARILADVADAAAALQQGRSQSALAMLQAILVAGRAVEQLRVDLAREAGPISDDDTD